MDFSGLLHYNCLMTFNSYSFILIFLPICVIGYNLLKKCGREWLPKVFLLAMSLIFYGFGNKKALLILLVSLCLNYLISILLRKNLNAAIAKIILGAGIVIDLAALIYFKYLTFFGGILNSIFKTAFTFESLLIPLGISFYTFSQIAYLVDCYRDSSLHVSFLDYAVFVTFFPKITVGPIALCTDMIREINETIRNRFDYERLSKGLIGLSFGLAKKVLIADNLSKYVDFGYSHIEVLGSTNAAIVMLAYTLQIYFDFSGYCDIARSICLMLGFDLPVNFNSPYRALSITDFWKRWHITLTNFFRRYLYIPLGGNRKGKFRTYLNNFLIFLISGLWHGANLTFLIWGAIHGIGIIISKLIGGFTKKLPVAVRFIITFIFINLSWVVFRAPDINTALTFYKELFTGGLVPVNIEFIAASTPSMCNIIQWLILEFTSINTYWSGLVIIMALLLFSLYASIFMKNTDERIETFKPSGRLIAACTVLLILSILSLSEVSKFIYVNF